MHRPACVFWPDLTPFPLQFEAQIPSGKTHTTSVAVAGAATADIASATLSTLGDQLVTSEKDAKLAQKLDQLQPFMAVFLLECMGQLASFGPI